MFEELEGADKSIISSRRDVVARGFFLGLLFFAFVSFSVHALSSPGLQPFPPPCGDPIVLLITASRTLTRRLSYEQCYAASTPSTVATSPPPPAQPDDTIPSAPASERGDGGGSRTSPRLRGLRGWKSNGSLRGTGRLCPPLSFVFIFIVWCAFFWRDGEKEKGEPY